MAFPSTLLRRRLRVTALCLTTVVAVTACRDGRPVLATSSDGFATMRVEPASLRAYRRYFPALIQAPVTSSRTRGLLRQSVISMRAGETALIAGGDGATFLPFEVAARRVDGRWQEFSPQLTDGARAYVSGGVVLADGQLLVLLDHWSSDRRGRSGPQHHGLWVSEGDDWSRYRPYGPKPSRGAGAITGIRANHHGDIWVTTANNRLYLSGPRARRFTAIAARPASATGISGRPRPDHAER